MNVDCFNSRPCHNSLDSLLVMSFIFNALTYNVCSSPVGYVIMTVVERASPRGTCDVDCKYRRVTQLLDGIHSGGEFRLGGESCVL